MDAITPDVSLPAQCSDSFEYNIGKVTNTWLLPWQQTPISVRTAGRVSKVISASLSCALNQICTQLTLTDARHYYSMTVRKL